MGSAGAIANPVAMLGNTGATEAVTDPFGKKSTQSALGSQQAATSQANRALSNMYGTQKKELQPWKAAGLSALGGLKNNNFMNDFTGDPGYQFRLGEGMKALQGSASAKGMLNSGRAMKDITRYGQDFASNEYGNAYNREYNRLSQLAGYGNQASQGLAGAAQTYGQNVSNNYTGMGNAQAAAQIAQGNRTSQMLGQGAGMAAMAFCDERLKTNIEPVSQAEITELKLAVRPYRFNYTKKEFGEGEWVGVMAQDLEKTKLGKSVVIEDEQGNKKVNLQKLLSILVACELEAA